MQILIIYTAFIKTSEKMGIKWGSASDTFTLQAKSVRVKVFVHYSYSFSYTNETS